MSKYLSKKMKGNRTMYTQILFVALAFVAMVALSYIYMGSLVRANLRRNALGLLDSTEEQIQTHRQRFEEVVEDAAAEVRDMVLRGDSVEMIHEYISDATRFSFLDSGRESGILDFYGYFETLPGGPVLLAYEGQALLPIDSPTESEWYRLAVVSDQVAVTSPVIVDASQTLYTYSKAIRDEAGHLLGVLCMEVDLGILGQEVVNISLNQGGYGMLLNQDLVTMFHPNPEFRGMRMDDPNFPPHILYDEVRRGQDINERPLMTYRDERAVGFFRNLPNGWYLGFVTPERQYYAGMGNMALTLLLMGAVLAAILIATLIRIDKARVRSDDENRKKSMFLANMSHEIRTPINAIVGMTAIGRAAGTDERKDYCFSKIDTASRHLLGVVNDILDISKIEANKIELSPTDFNFEKMLQQAVSVATFRADEKHQRLMVHIDKEIPKVLFGDDQRLVQVLTNLLSNAVKFTQDEGTINLNTKFLGEEKGVCTIQVEVSDNGIGISKEQQAKLFQSFQQAESSTTRKYGGTGLGLAISKSIVELMGGKIWIESELGEGTKFIFTIKLTRGEESHFDLGNYGINWGNVRILAIDDDPDILLYFQEMMAGFGISCRVAQGAEEALNLIEEDGHFNIYFIDLRMPDVDGISLTKEIRAREKNMGNSVVIMISSADLSTVESDAKRAGVNKFLLKPLFPSAIADVVNECIGIVNEKIEEAPVDIDGVFAGHRILLAEDVDINREIVIALLESTLLGIDCAANGIEAVRMFHDAPGAYEMIFMDIQMPEMDGYEATRQIRALNCPEAGTIPIIAMTANVFKDDVENCLAAGMNGHLGKPLDIDEVIRTLYRYLLVGEAEMEDPN